ncbi:MAG TPA: SDR family oxidoreductase [Vicinamibacterales bacterium]|jgi:NADP-dependent 3-hydroxy acid dehydrogenase YdfG|nr:SDR family oxidoreductase [Vicinamibacterales bacterium]
MMSLAGKVAVITGASSGIGLACAHEFARRGAAVVLGARRKDRLDEAVDEITRSGGRATALAVDVTREADVDALVGEATSRFGRLDVMLCNAGFGYYGTLEQTPPATMREMMDVNYMGTFVGARAAMPIFRAQQSGHLIFVSSIVARRGIAFMGGYTATKAAQSGLAEALRAEFVGTPIHVTCVYPVSTETEFRDAMVRHSGHRITGLGPRQPVELVARAIADCVERPRPEVYPHAKSRALGIISLLAPALTDRFVRKFARRRDAAAES